MRETRDLLSNPDQMAEMVELNYEIARRHYSYANLDKLLVALISLGLGLATLVTAALVFTLSILLIGSAAAVAGDLEAEVAAGRFREDLFYRLSVFPIEVPPLRERGEDVIQLAREFLTSTCKDFGREPMTLTRGQANKLRAYDWPGNVRELKNVIERAVILSPGNVLRLDASLPELTADGQDAAAEAGAEPGFLTEQEMREFQKKNTIAALEQAAWRVSGAGGAADLLGIKPTTLADRIRVLSPHRAVLLAVHEANLRRLAREYRRTERRARALENVLLPETQTLLRSIEDFLDEADQEEAIPLLDPTGEKHIEYDITRIISRVQSPEKLKIGVITTLTTPAAVLGEEQMNGINLAMENLGGKMAGTEVEIIAEDDGFKPDIGKQKADKLVQQDDVDIVTGVIWSNTLLAVKKPILDAGKFLIGANAGTSLPREAMCSFSSSSIRFIGPRPCRSFCRRG